MRVLSRRRLEAGKYPILVCLVVLLFLGAASEEASAITLFSQPLDNTADYGANSNGVNSNTWTTQQIADGFSLAAASTLLGVSWFGFYGDGGTPVDAKSFVIRLFSESSGLPDSILFSQTVSAAGTDTTLDNTSALSIMSYSAALVAVPGLIAGTAYFLSVLENDASTTAAWAWSLSDVNSGSTAAARLGDVGGWTSIPVVNPPAGYNMAFSLEGTSEPVPEPATGALLALGLCGLGVARRRRSA